jgi:hypothetical protein
LDVLYYSGVSDVILFLPGEKGIIEFKLSQQNLTLWLILCALNKKRL